MRECLGKITRVTQEGVGIILEEGENGRTFFFTFDAIEGYKGEYPKELGQFSPKGLREGVLVMFTPAKDERNKKASSVRPLVFSA